MSAVASIPLISIAANVSSRARKDTNGSTAYSFLSIENILPASGGLGDLPQDSWLRSHIKGRRQIIRQVILTHPLLTHYREG